MSETTTDVHGLPVIRRWFLLRTPWFRMMLHRLYQPDPSPMFHTHAWNFFSLVVRGSYLQMLPDGKLSNRRWFNYLSWDTLHRVVSVQGQCTTLAFAWGRERTPVYYVRPHDFHAHCEYLEPPHDAKPLP